jgi:hypothetical protein
MNQADYLFDLAQQIADGHTDFFKIKGPGVGDRDTGKFMALLRERASHEFGKDFSEQRICGSNKLAVDFYFPDEQTIVEVALGLRNPGSEFERDILKAIMAHEQCNSVKRLLFITKPGADKRHSQPSSRAILEWAKRRFDIRIDIRELSNHS